MNNEHILMMRSAKGALSFNWLSAVIGTLIYLAVMSLATSTALVEYIVGGPLTLGYLFFLLNLVRTRDANFALLFDGFNRFVETLVAGALSTLAVSFGLALLIVPGIIAALGFSMTFFLMADNPGLSGLDALQRSWNIMQGHKTDLLCLWLRFIGWFLLCLLTCGIGFLWLTPYMTLATHNYYRKLVYGSF